LEVLVPIEFLAKIGDASCTRMIDAQWMAPKGKDMRAGNAVIKSTLDDSRAPTAITSLAVPQVAAYNCHLAGYVLADDLLRDFGYCWI
jgi:hypothetical protein